MNSIDRVLSDLLALTEQNSISWLSFDHPFAQALLSVGNLAFTSFQMEFHVIESKNSFLALYERKVYLILDETFYSGVDDSELHQVNLYTAADPDNVQLVGSIPGGTDSNVIHSIREQLGQ